MTTLHWIDYVILGVLALSVLTGLIRGFVRELVALSVWIAAIWVAYTYAPQISPWFRSYFHDAKIQYAASFIVLLLATLLVGSLLSSTLSFILNRSPLKGTDRMLGMGFGLARGMFIVALLIGILNLTALTKEETFKHALLYAKFKPLSTWLFSFMPEKMQPAADKQKQQATTQEESHADTHPSTTEQLQ